MSAPLKNFTSSYTEPIVSSIAFFEAANVSVDSDSSRWAAAPGLESLETLGGDVVLFNGSNFGPATSDNQVHSQYIYFDAKLCV